MAVRNVRVSVNTDTGVVTLTDSSGNTYSITEASAGEIALAVANAIADELEEGGDIASAITAALSLASTSISNGTPVNASAATGTLTLTGVVIDGETVTINGVDVYEFCADASQSLTAGSTIAVDITAYVTASQGTLTAWRSVCDWR
jgi:hypothetical protein